MPQYVLLGGVSLWICSVIFVTCTIHTTVHLNHDFVICLFLLLSSLTSGSLPRVIFAWREGGPPEAMKGKSLAQGDLHLLLIIFRILVSKTLVNCPRMACICPGWWCGYPSLFTPNTSVNPKGWRPASYHTNPQDVLKTTDNVASSWI